MLHVRLTHHPEMCCYCAINEEKNSWTVLAIAKHRCVSHWYFPL